MRKVISMLLAIGLVLSLAACGGGNGTESGKIVISGKKYTEQVILTNIMAEYLKAKTDLEVEVEEALGGVFVLQEAMKKGDIDMYVEYTGTGYLNVLKNEYTPGQSPDEIFEATKKGYAEEFNVAWLEPLGFNNTYALALRSELAKELGTKTYTDLVANASDLSFGADPEFFERTDGYDALAKEYGFEFGDKKNIDPDLQYTAAKDGQIDIITAFSTDARIAQYGLVVLEDDKNFFPPYYAAPIIRKEVLDANPGLADTINELSNILSDARMIELNAKVNIDKMQPKEVAIEFLKAEGLID
ncbi:glycine betaine ABC transporter substrate-binding protein [Cytobacillus sp. S13-E01]|uniref:glycine betaine ABC transporter substrate-binding protein n=1 Tax=Cytobacillus sp. S13-E01 TaxID=3031326 RepID=UPI0023D834D0|nr:glycine betaine ABC transporter substrate-binding protein [Cytobacillus sp. S13-E01]MDF0725814.1 glycine betaine ABC transporter substrate-binding protein [Cytobacillus sp. S13-E01]